ncbi:unnamed protein product, partial [Staurois parvus]
CLHRHTAARLCHFFRSSSHTAGVCSNFVDIGCWPDYRPPHSCCQGALNLPAPYDKMEPTSSVRRPESGTWQSVAMETAAMGGRTGTHDTLWTWQQH